MRCHPRAKEQWNTSGIFIKSFLAVPILFCCLAFCVPANIYISELHLSISRFAYPFWVLIGTMIWLCVLPRSIYENIKLAELSVYFFPAVVFSLPIFSQWHFVISLLLVIFIFTAEVLFCIYLRQSNPRRYRKFRHQYWQCAARVFIFLVSAVLMVPFLTSTVIYELKGPTYEATRELWTEILGGHDVSSDDSQQEDILQANIELLKEFQQSRWETHSIEARVDLMQSLTVIECERLGIPPVAIVVENLDTHELGHYTASTNQIKVSTESVQEDSAESILSALTHEAFHAHEYFLTQHFDWDSEISNCIYFDELRTWKENFSHYISALYDYEAYIAQPVEAAAQAWSEEETLLILEYIHNDGI